MNSVTYGYALLAYYSTMYLLLMQAAPMSGIASNWSQCIDALATVQHGGKRLLYGALLLIAYPAAVPLLPVCYLFAVIITGRKA